MTNADSPIGRWLAIGAVVILAGFFLCAYLTRYRMDWNALLRKWSREYQEHASDGGAPRDDDRSGGRRDRWSQSRTSRMIFVGGVVLAVLGVVLAVVFHSAGWVALGVVGALMEGGVALVAGLRSGPPPRRSP